ncbi:MAG TPA: diaminopimelate epimerase [Spirochaetota bacterium]|nr:diaminopimelate epimerase [Spirochaetota bacterium]HOM87962.1 diaminopimelate epimerase [Spirochaetota bacterium]HOR93691.1 diaminopimelate epimerase [Spirochaetota bacterium]HOT19962.1 diaminopimelate epimerase [Spirochaetota bacterium]HPD04518.1 diaminopimelate epimerase [Spirochaetota bacterium]
MPFTKLHGIGNDYIYINAIKHSVKNPKKLAIAMSNRNFGVGSDGLILILPSDKADFTMRMFNADGSEAEMCGNGIRGFAKYVYDHNLTKKTTIAIETLAGIKQVRCTLKNGKVHTVTVDMGEPILLRDKIPMIGNPGTVIEEDLHVDGVKFSITAVSMGNPHVVIYVEDVKNFPVEKYGPMIENHELFPKRTNVEFVQIVTGKEVIQRTWERGSGETLACGTGASAVTVAGVLTEKTDRRLKVHLKGGNLAIEWNNKDNHVYLAGPAEEVFEGVWP